MTRQQYPENALPAEQASVTPATGPPPVRDVPPGTLVIYTDGDGHYEYQGPTTSNAYAEVTVAVGAGAHHGLKCDPGKVAPADTPIPATDNRVVVTKQQPGSYPTHEGPWLLTVDGAARDFFPTKRAGTAAGLRTVAILDWHAGPVVLPHTGMTVPHTGLTVHKPRTMATSDGVAYTAELRVAGQPAGTIENTGTGGPTMWYPHDRNIFSRADMSAYVAACRNEQGEPMDEEFVLAALFEEACTARDVARYARAGKIPVRTLATITNGDDEIVGTFVDAYYGVPHRSAAAVPLDRLAAALWRRLPDAHGIQVWTGQRWRNLQA